MPKDLHVDVIVIIACCYLAHLQEKYTIFRALRISE